MIPVHFFVDAHTNDVDPMHLPKCMCTIFYIYIHVYVYIIFTFIIGVIDTILALKIERIFIRLAEIRRKCYSKIRLVVCHAISVMC